MEHRPWVVAVTGAPGSGKSSTAHALARDAGELRDVKAYVAGLDPAAPRSPFVEVDAALPVAEQAVPC